LGSSQSPQGEAWSRAHLLRDIDDLRSLHPEDARLARWAQSVHRLYTRARAFTPQRGQEHRAQLALEEKLLALCRPFLNDPLAMQGKLCRRMERFIKELFVFVADPAVPSENNAAERSLRHLVTGRKISGGTRSEQGTNSKMTLSSLFGTWRTRGLNPVLECRKLLASPQA
jgi:transposase